MTNQFIDLFQNDFLIIFPEMFFVTVTTFLLMYGVVFSTSKAHNYPILIQNVGHLGILATFYTFCLLFQNPVENAVFFYNCFFIDDLTFFFKSLVLLTTIAALFLSLDYVRQEGMNAFEYVILILLSTWSMLCIISSYDFISMYLAIELQALCFYVLAASKRNSEFSTEAGLKYFILGAFSSGILLFGCSMIYGFTGVTNFEDLARIFTGLAAGQDPSSSASFFTSSGILLGLTFLTVGFLFKLTAVPFHMWAPDVYEGSPTSVTAFFAMTPKIAILGLFLRLFFFSFYDLMIPWQKILFVCSIGSMVLGAFAAMSQKKLKRLLAFSSIGHIGYILLGMTCGTVEGIQALLLYLLIYVFMTLNVFAILLSLREQGKQIRVKYISDLGLLGQTNPLLALTFTLTLFSLAGIPPLAGFCSKFYIFFAALGSSLYSLAFIGVMASVLSCFYYIRIIKIMYFEKSTEWIVYQQIDREKSILLAISIFFLTFFFLYPSPLFILTYQVALSLCP